MGWAQRKDTDSYMLRKEMMNHLDLDLVGIAETYLLGDRELEIDEYAWFGSNRKNIHIKAKKGSGGVGFLIRNNIMEHYNVMVEADTKEGILWLKFISKLNKAELHTCVYHLPPIESSRNFDAGECFDN